MLKESEVELPLQLAASTAAPVSPSAEKFALFGPLALPKDDDVRVWREEGILEVAAVHDLNSLA